MKHFVVQGGNRLEGEVFIPGAKNSAIKLIAASLLTNQDVRIKNLPVIDDVKCAVDVVSMLGAKVNWLNERTLEINASDVNKTGVTLELAKKSRVALLVVGPLLHRFGEAVYPIPRSQQSQQNTGGQGDKARNVGSGDRIGWRAIDRHIEAYQALGTDVEYRGGRFIFTAKNLKGGKYHFPASSHMGTENAILGAVLADGETVLTNAAEEAEVDDLINFLNTLGANVIRTKEDPRKIVINGVSELKGGEYAVMGDTNQAVTYMSAAVLTKGFIKVKGVDAKNINAYFSKLEKVGAHYEVEEDEIRVWTNEEDDIQPIPYFEALIAPGFKTDWVAPFVAVLTQAQGVSVIQDTVYSNRFGYVNELNKLGADIELLTAEEAGIQFRSDDVWFPGPHKNVIRINAPTNLVGTEVRGRDVRAGAAMVLAGLAARGETKVVDIEHTLRGYENLDGNLKNLGLDVVLKD